MKIVAGAGNAPDFAEKKLKHLEPQTRKRNSGSSKSNLGPALKKARSGTNKKPIEDAVAGRNEEGEEGGEGDDKPSLADMVKNKEKEHTEVNLEVGGKELSSVEKNAAVFGHYFASFQHALLVD